MPAKAASAKKGELDVSDSATETEDNALGSNGLLDLAHDLTQELDDAAMPPPPPSPHAAGPQRPLVNVLT